MDGSQHRSASARARRSIRVRGTVQGVGFRPAVFRLARSAKLAGFVRNDPEGVLIEIEGDAKAVSTFAGSLASGAPPLAHIDSIESRDIAPRGEQDFVVAPSGEPANGARARIPSDAPACDACVRELFDTRDRRFRYPFLTCTDCGPRYSIIRDLPYDRATTTMSAFAMCEACRAEYEDPADRRFHAEPIACPRCGPTTTLVVDAQPMASGDDAVRQTVALLAKGAIVAVKGLGGYQLAVDAANEEAVARLRRRKNRPDKPFAIMIRDLATAKDAVSISEAARAALESHARPIVLLPMRGRAPIAPSVAPRLRELGVMLPTTPLHHLLLDGGPSLLVMTSGNVTDEPIAKDDDDALAKLSAIADAFLAHDRPIHTRVDDSVVRIVGSDVQPVRRARGLAPDAIPLGTEAPAAVLAVGAELKNTVTLVRGEEAFVAQHHGDLGALETRAFFEETIAKLSRLLGTTPAFVAHDLHPDYASTRWALESGLQPIAVQHHHAHVVACLAEHGRTGPAIGVAFDGTGCGPAGDLWGGELLLFDRARFVRVAHLRPIALAGGETAIREPWRIGVAALADAGEPIVDPAPRVNRILRLIEHDTACAHATGAGRWFDAVSAILGVRERITYEAQAAIELEALGRASDDERSYACEIERRAPFEIDLRPTIRAIAADLRAGTPREHIASRFYATMADAIATTCVELRRLHGIGLVALSGGCFQSALLGERTRVRLEREGFEVLEHRRVPPNDGGISFGQAAIAVERITRKEDRYVPRHPWRSRRRA